MEVYFILTDKENYGTVIGGKNGKHYQYVSNKKEWVRTGIMLEYYCDESPLYEMYEEISKEKAMELINKM